MTSTGPLGLNTLNFHLLIKPLFLPARVPLALRGVAGVCSTGRYPTCLGEFTKGNGVPQSFDFPQRLAVGAPATFPCSPHLQQEGHFLDSKMAR